MITEDLILQTKLQPPQIKGRILLRERLLNLLKENLDKKLILICADAGYGKTTLLAQFCEKFDKPFMFYDLDISDNDIATFFNYLVSGIQSHHPDFGQRTKGIIPQTRNIEILVGTFINEFVEKIKEEFYIILDDYHHLQQNKEIGSALDYLLRHLPINLHLIISSRSTPSLNLAYYLAKQELFKLEKEQLQFNLKEIQTLLKEVHGLKIPDEEIVRIEKHSEGWITAIQLILQKISVAGEEKAKETLNGYVASGEEVFNYFAREIYEDQPEEIQEFLMKTSILKHLTPDICNYLLNIKKSGEFLSYLEIEHIFITKVNHTTYKYHPLFKDFLVKIFESYYGFNKVNNLYQKVALFYCKLKEYYYAVEFFLSASNYEKAADILEKQYPISASNFYLYLDLTNSIPKYILNHHPVILMRKVYILIHFGYYKEALAIAKNIQKTFRKRKNFIHEMNILADISYIYQSLMQPLKSLYYAKKTYKLLPIKNNYITIKSLATLSDAYCAIGDYNKAHKLLKEAAMRSDKISGSTVELEIFKRFASLYTQKYDYKKAAIAYSNILEKPVKSFGPFQYSNICSNAAITFIELNELPRAEELLDIVMQTARKYNDQRAIAYSTGIRGNLYLHQGKFEKAIVCYDKSLKLNQKVGEKRLNIFSLNALINSYLLMKNPKKARELLNNLEAHIARDTPKPMLFEYLIAKGRVTGDTNAFKNAGRLAKHLNISYWKMVVDYYWGEYYFNKGDIKSADKYFKKSLEIARRENYDHFLIRVVHENLKIFEFCLQNEIEKDFIIDILKKIDSEDIKNLLMKTELPLSHYDLEVHLLGNIEIYNSQGEMVIPRWKGRKARSLFIYLLMNRNKKVTRDQLLDNFWPKLGLNEAIRSLHANFTYIRQTLSSLLNLPATTKELILSSRACYQLNPRIYIKCDVQEFDVYLKKAVSLEKINRAKSIEFYEKTLSLYRGDFCREVYDSWCEDMKLYFREQALKIAKKLGELYYQEQNYEKALNFYKKAIEIDSIDEKGYLGAMQCFGYLRDKRAIYILYKKYKETLRKEMNMSPASEVIRTYQKIISSI